MIWHECHGNGLTRRDPGGDPRTRPHCMIHKQENKQRRPGKLENNSKRNARLGRRSVQHGHGISGGKGRHVPTRSTSLGDGSSPPCRRTKTSLASWVIALPAPLMLTGRSNPGASIARHLSRGKASFTAPPPQHVHRRGSSRPFLHGDALVAGPDLPPFLPLPRPRRPEISTTPGTPPRESMSSL
jgi:hypothetical protein